MQKQFGGHWTRFWNKWTIIWMKKFRKYEQHIWKYVNNNLKRAKQRYIRYRCRVLTLKAFFFSQLGRGLLIQFHLKESIVNCLSYLIFQAYFRFPKRFNASKKNVLTELKSILSWRRPEDVKILWHRRMTTLGLLFGQQIINSFCFAWIIILF